MTDIRIRRTAAGAILSLFGVLCGTAPAQTLSGDTVAWTVSTPARAVKPGERLTVTLHGAVLNGWHVYGLKQLPEGPTPLSVTVDPNGVAKPAGAATGSTPEKVLDPGFGVVTPFYDHDFPITVPVQITSRLAGGQQTIPVSVRFQTCDGRTCKPPKTVTLSAPVSVHAG